MGKIKIAFFDAKDYDKQSFVNSNANDEFEIIYLETRLTEDTCKLAEGCDVVMHPFESLDKVLHAEVHRL